MASRGSNQRDESGGRRAGWFRWRGRLVVGLLVLVGLGIGVHGLWQQQAPSIGQDARYRIDAASIHATPQPSWIRSSVLADVLRDARLAGALSVLDDPQELKQRIAAAFEVHPWIKQVNRLTLRLPAGIDVELEYRQPMAAVETSGQHGVALVVIDADGVRLPDADFSTSPAWVSSAGSRLSTATPFQAFCPCTTAR